MVVFEYRYSIMAGAGTFQYARVCACVGLVTELYF